MNYCCDRNGMETSHLAEALGDRCEDGWARQPGYVYKAEDAYRRCNFADLNRKKWVPLLRWAGSKLSPAMPEAELFYQFRDAELGRVRRCLRKIGRIAMRAFIRLVQHLRANRWIKTTYLRVLGQ